MMKLISLACLWIALCVHRSIAVGLSTFTCPGTMPATPNVLLNPSFEQDTVQDPTKYTLGWQLSTTENGNTLRVGPTGDAPRPGETAEDGNYFWRFSNQMDITLSTTAGVPVELGQYYLLSFWARRTVGYSSFKGKVKLNVGWTGQTLGQNVDSFPAPTTSWKQYCYPTLLQGGLALTQILSFTFADPPYVLGFDNVVLQKIDQFQSTSTVVLPATTTTTTTTTETDTATQTTTVFFEPATTTLTVEESVTDSTTSTSTTTTTSTTTLAAPTATVTGKCLDIHLSFEAACCPRSFCQKKGSGVRKRTVTLPTTTETTTSTSTSTSTESDTTTTTEIDTETSTLPTPTATQTETTTVSTQTDVVPETATVSASTQLPTQTATVCHRIDVPKFFCPRGVRSQQLISAAELAFLKLYKQKYSSGGNAPSLSVTCDGDPSTYLY